VYKREGDRVVGEEVDEERITSLLEGAKSDICGSNENVVVGSYIDTKEHVTKIFIEKRERAEGCEGVDAINKVKIVCKFPKEKYYDSNEGKWKERSFTVKVNFAGDISLECKSDEKTVEKTLSSAVNKITLTSIEITRKEGGETISYVSGDFKPVEVTIYFYHDDVAEGKVVFKKATSWP